MTEQKKPSRSLRLNSVRLAFPAVFKPRPKSKDQPDKLTYQATLLLPPSFDLAPLKAAAQAAVVAKFDKVVRCKNPIRPAEDKEGMAGFEPGWHFISAWSNQRPAVVDRRAVPITDESVIYPGVWVNCHVSAFAWDHPTGGKGVSFNLDALQFVKDDERLDGRVNVGNVFEALDDEGETAVVSQDDDENPFL